MFGGNARAKFEEEQMKQQRVMQKLMAKAEIQGLQEMFHT